MPDVFSKAKRSEVMSRVRGTGNAATELVLVSFFRDHRITGWRRHLPIFGRPDFVFRNLGTLVFVDGCFWHGCKTHLTMPSTNREFWQEKIARNIRRDRLVNRTLKKAGWTVIRVWQHELRNLPRLRLKLASLVRNPEST